MKEALEKRQKPKEEVQQGVGPKSVGNPSITGHVQVEPQEKVRIGLTSTSQFVITYNQFRKRELHPHLCMRHKKDCLIPRMGMKLRHITDLS